MDGMHGKGDALTYDLKAMQGVEKCGARFYLNFIVISSMADKYPSEEFSRHRFVVVYVLENAAIMNMKIYSNSPPLSCWAGFISPLPFTMVRSPKECI